MFQQSTGNAYKEAKRSWVLSYRGKTSEYAEDCGCCVPKRDERIRQIECQFEISQRSFCRAQVCQATSKHRLIICGFVSSVKVPQDLYNRFSCDVRDVYLRIECIHCFTKGYAPEVIVATSRSQAIGSMRAQNSRSSRLEIMSLFGWIGSVATRHCSCLS